MIVKGLITNVDTDAELKALTGMVNNDFVYHNGVGAAYIYEAKFKTGDIISDSVGVWNKERIECLDLEGYKATRFVEIDDRTEELIKQGFTYQGLVFSLSQNAQINILGMDVTRDNPALTYPIEYSTIDDLNGYSVVDSTDLHYMYLTAMATKKNYVDSGTDLKDLVRDAIDYNAVSLIIDNR